MFIEVGALPVQHTTKGLKIEYFRIPSLYLVEKLQSDDRINRPCGISAEQPAKPNRSNAECGFRNAECFERGMRIAEQGIYNRMTTESQAKRINSEAEL